MIRVLSSACVVLLLVLGGKAGAGGKPPIAILGLEVVDNSSNGSGIDPDTTKAAKELTAALRERAKAGTGPYIPAPNGEKELIDEKLLNNCDSEAAACMAAIGTELGAEALIYGKIEKDKDKSQNGQMVYKVSIKLLSVSHKQLVKATVETLSLADATGVRASAAAKSWYNKLVGIDTGGTVAISTNIDRGTVMLDEEAKGNLASGKLTLNNVAEGRHTLAIEAKDYQRYETSITVHNGETLQQNVTMAEMSKKSPPGAGESISREGTVGTQSGIDIWKPVFIGTAVAEAGAVGFTVFSIVKSKSEADKIAKMSQTVSQKDCGASTNLGGNDLTHFKSACDWHDRQIIGWVVTGVVGAAVVGSFYMAFVRDRDHTETRTANGGHKKRRELAVTPVLTPDGGGATLRFDW